MEELIIEFSGWIRCNPKKVFFQYIGEDESRSEELIDGIKFMTLSKEEREDYIPEDISKVMSEADELEWSDIQTIVE